VGDYPFSLNFLLRWAHCVCRLASSMTIFAIYVNVEGMLNFWARWCVVWLGTGWYASGSCRFYASSPVWLLWILMSRKGTWSLSFWPIMDNVEVVEKVVVSYWEHSAKWQINYLCT
jgi:hypothetical protein